jgi:ribosomal protein L7/L12
MKNEKLKSAVPEGFEEIELKSMSGSIFMDVDIVLSDGVKKGEKFDLWYSRFHQNKAAAMATIRSMTGMGLGELSEKVHGPFLLKEGLSITELNQLIARYSNSGIRYFFKE